MEKEVLKKLIITHINQIPYREFVIDNGYPNLSHIDVLFFDVDFSKSTIIGNIGIVYGINRAGCCFIPGSNDTRILMKSIEVNGNQIVFLP